MTVEQPKEVASAAGGQSRSNVGLEGGEPRLYPRAHRYCGEVVDGHRIINGRPHGFSYKPLWTVAVQFDSEAEATEFFGTLREHGIAGRKIWTIGS